MAWPFNHSRHQQQQPQFDAHKAIFQGKPTRFKIAMTISTKNDQCGMSWDLHTSLWDSYEIVSCQRSWRRVWAWTIRFRRKQSVKRRKESKNSLRSLFNRMSSKRFLEEDLPSDGEFLVSQIYLSNCITRYSILTQATKNFIRNFLRHQ
ncbi:hypothetical protein DH2020_019211 [Rehmannia glutinosa]|uniref:Uncharacterized protein n=1 Tax=Rehmannia glutinosa TaxID=99300 RepID=A0ABR0WMI1_REHGL